MEPNRQEAVEDAARQEGREALAMPVVSKRTKPIDASVIYGIGDTGSLIWYATQSGLHFDQESEVRLLDLEPQAAYTALQNQIESLQAQQTYLLAAAFETGPEVTLEHLEAVVASGELAVERLRAE